MNVSTPSKGQLLAALISLIIALPQLSAIPVWINEIHYDNNGGDVGEFVEIAGVAGTDISSYSLTLYNGSNGTTYGSIALSGVLPNQSNGFGTLAFFQTGIQNGNPDGLFLSGPSVSLFLSYEGTFTATNGPANGQTSTNIGVLESTSSPIGKSLQLKGTGSTYSDFNWTNPSVASPRSINDGQTFTAESVPENASSMTLFIIGIGGLLTLKRWSLKRGLL